MFSVVLLLKQASTAYDYSPFGASINCSAFGASMDRIVFSFCSRHTLHSVVLLIEQALAAFGFSPFGAGIGCIPLFNLWSKHHLHLVILLLKQASAAIHCSPFGADCVPLSSFWSIRFFLLLEQA